MKLLCFSDIHNSESAIAHILQRAGEVDLIVGAGDFCTIHRGLAETIAALGEMQTPAFFVPGNNESLEELQDCCRPYPQIQVLHGSAARFSDVIFYGVGGGVPVTPFGSWSWDFSEAEAAALLKDLPERAVLISHSPPRGSLDRTSFGIHVGSLAVREAIVCKRPLLTVCGHIHESSGRMVLCEGTPLINAGPRGMEYEIEAEFVPAVSA